MNPTARRSPCVINRGRARTLFVLCLLCLAVWAQSSALALENHAHHSSEHCCLLCHTGPLPFLQTEVSTSAAPVLLVAWVASAAEYHGAPEALVPTRSSRAPPA